MPAFNVNYHLYKNGKIEKKDILPTLDTGEERVVYGSMIEINSEDFGKMNIRVVIEYQNILGENKSLLFYKPPGTMQFPMMS